MKIFRVGDVETTGLGATAGIVELGWTDLIWEGTQMRISDQTHAYLCNPGIPIEYGAMAEHHITQEMLADEPHVDEILPFFMEGCDFFVFHNAKFDTRYLPCKKPVICTMKCAQTLWPNAPAFKNQVLRYWRQYDLVPERAQPAHRAGPDTYVTANILLDLLKTSAEQGGDFVKRLIDLSTSSTLLTTIPFGKYRGQTWEEVAKRDIGYLRWILQNPQAEDDVRFTAQHWINQMQQNRGSFSRG